MFPQSQFLRRKVLKVSNSSYKESPFATISRANKNSSSSSPQAQNKHQHPYKQLQLQLAKKKNSTKKKTIKNQSISGRYEYTKKGVKNNASKPSANTNTSSSSSSSSLARILKRSIQNIPTTNDNNYHKENANDVAIVDAGVNKTNKYKTNCDNININDHHDTKTTTNLLGKCMHIMDKLIQKKSKLPPPSISWLQTFDNSYYNDCGNNMDENYNGDNDKAFELPLQQARMELYQDTIKLIQIVQSSTLDIQSFINNSSSSSNYKSREQITSLLTNILILCSEIPPPHILIPSSSLSSASSLEHENDETTNNNNTKSPLPLPTMNTTEYALQIIQLIQSLNQDIQPIHYASIIQTANYNQNYNISNSFFEKQINIDEFGYAPMDGSLGWNKFLEMGLYGIAMKAITQEEVYDKKHDDDDDENENDDFNSCMVVEKVMNAVEEMCLVSPMDQERYILAAGAVLGRVGQSKQFIQYIQNIHNNSNNTSSKKTHNQTLIAAGMQACYQHSKYSEALDLYYNYVMNDPSSVEWQWGGGYVSIHPLCNDLALRCMGLVSKEERTLIDIGISNNFEEYGDDHDGDDHDDDIGKIDGDRRDTYTYADQVTNMLQKIIEERGMISQEALLSILRTYEMDGEFEKAIYLMKFVTSQPQEGGQRERQEWKVVDESLENFLTDTTSTTTTITSTATMDGAEHDVTSEDKSDVLKLPSHKLLSSVMNSCNAAGEFGLAILLNRIGVTGSSSYQSSITLDDPDFPKQIVDKQALLLESDDVLAATMFALCCLGCSQDAILLHSEVMAKRTNDYEFWEFSNECLEYANSLKEMSSRRSWTEAYRHIDRTLVAVQSIEKTKLAVSDEEKYILSSAVAKMVRSCSAAGQTRTGLYLANIAAATVAKCEEPSKKSMKDVVKSFFGLDSNTKRSTIHGVSKASLNKFLSHSDEILSALMEAYREIDDTDNSLELFFNKWEGDPSMRKSVRSAPFHSNPDNPDQKWIKSCDLILEILVDRNNLELAHSFYQAILPSYRSHYTYIIMARAFALEEKWDEVEKLYSTALNNGCLSEELGLIAMEGIAQGEVNGKIRILRTVADHVASITGMKSGRWIFKNYWTLKRQLGFHYARLLMWWNDPARTQQEELRLALQHFEESKKNRSMLDPDAIICIIQLAGHKQRRARSENIKSTVDDEEENPNPTALIINAVLESFALAPGADHSAIILEGVIALTNLGSNRECIDLVEKVVDKGIYLDRHILKIATKAALAESDTTALKTIRNLSPEHT